MDSGQLTKRNSCIRCCARAACFESRPLLDCLPSPLAPLPLPASSAGTPPPSPSPSHPSLLTMMTALKMTPHQSLRLLLLLLLN